MRCAPLALLRDDHAVITDCSLSNPHPVCIDTNRVYISALRGGNNNDIFQHCWTVVKTPEVKSVLTEVEKGTMRDLTKFKGWCLHGLWCAIFCLLGVEMSSYENIMDWVISHPDSDTDTNGTITGSLIGAYLGYDGLMREERTKTNIPLLLSCNTQNSDIPRPQEYTLPTCALA